jgi:peroxiredoxin
LWLVSFVAVAQPGFHSIVVPRPAPALNLLAPCKGKLTLLAFIVTTCPHCKAFTRQVMEPLHESKQICAIAVAFDQEGDTERFSRQSGLTFPVFKLDRKLVREFLGIAGPDRALGTPQVVLIDKAGTVQAQSAPEGSPLLLQQAVIRDLVERLK